MKYLGKPAIKAISAANSFRPGMIYAGIAFIVILFNLIAIFGLDILLHDDPAFYTSVLNGEFPWWLMRHSLISPFTEWIGWNIMAYSPHLARGLYTVFLMVPISCCFYYVCHHRFGFSQMTAFTAAVLPNILPLQWQLPAGINMSYVLWGLLVSLLSLILGFQYLEKDTPKNWIRLTAAILCYFIATQIMEQAIFLLPPFVLAFWGYKKFAKKSIFLMAGFTIIAIPRLIQAIVNPRGSAVICAIPLDETARRILLYFKWSLPLPNIEPIYLTIIFMLIISAGFILYLKRPAAEPKTKKVFLYIFLFVWTVSTIFAFIFMSSRFLPRYVFISSFGLNAVFVFSIYLILHAMTRGKFRLYIPVFAALIIFSGVSRYFNLNKIYSHKNTDCSIVKRDLNKRDLPPHSQIVISDLNGIVGGEKKHRRWKWKTSSGYLQFALKRKDVSGFISVRHGGYFNYDNHFERGRDKMYHMTGLSMDYPVFLFQMDKKSRQLEQLEYALQWRGEKMDASWTIMRVDKNTGALFPFVSGIGMHEYNSAIFKLQKKGIMQSDILWGGPPSKEEQKRLELK